METDPAVDSCTVCGDPAAEPSMRAECNWCDAVFHLNQRNDTDARDCGEVWIDEQYLALQFACNNCLRADGVAADPRQQAKAAPARPRRYKRRA